MDNLGIFARNTLREIADDRLDHHREFAASDLLDHYDREADRFTRVMLNIAWMMVAMILALCAMCCAAPQKLGRTVEEEHTNAVRIMSMCYDPATQQATGNYGSGVAISNTHVLTAYHVAQRMHTSPPGTCVLGVGFDDDVHGKKPPRMVRVSRVWPELDVAELELIVPVKHVEPVKFGPTPRAGATVCVTVGYPMFFRRCGQSGYYAPSKRPQARYAAVLVEPGNSGSGVYDAQGRLVGIATDYITCGPNKDLCESVYSLIPDAVHHVALRNADHR